MNSSVCIKIRILLAFTLFIILVGYLSYLVVYKVSFLPNGYDIVSQQKDSVTVKSYNIIGGEKDFKALSFSENHLWKIKEINYEVKRQKDFFWFLFTASSFSSLLLILKLRKGEKFWRAVWGSRIVFAILFPLFIIVNSLNRIQYLIS